MKHFDKGFMTAADLKKAHRYLNMSIITPKDFQKICTTMRDDNYTYKSFYDFEHHEKIKEIRQEMYGGLLPE